MQIRILFTAALAAALVLPLAARADGWAQNAEDWWDAGGYLAGDVGQAHFSGVTNQANTSSSGSTSSFSDNNTGWRLALGYQFTAPFALELGYVDFGSINGTVNFSSPGSSSFSSSRKAHGYYLDGVFSAPFGNSGWFGYLRLGAIDGHVSYNNTSVGSIAVPASGSSSDWRATYGVGVRYSFAQHWSVRLGWDQYHDLGNDSTVGRGNVNLASVGLMLRF